MSKHTPGPWHVQDDHGKRWIETSGNDDTIAEIHRRASKGGVYSCKEASANAQLIAAAPELLADLEEAAKTLRRYEILHWAKETNESDAKAKVNGDLAARFERTIDKARGKP
ncbi:hypothetical protein [Pseudomonas sp. p106]|uniref:hypothetical protein n=1 Tax=Pseudomonas sp. p106 TaxID=2479854 RepID=UPI000F7A1C11|nr:hypothetical protein [Pseudomonas sp. p106]